MRKLLKSTESHFRTRTMVGAPDHEDSVGMGIRQSPEKDGIDCAEDGRAGADAKRKGKDSYRRKTRMSAQLTCAKTQIGEQSSDGILPAKRAQLFNSNGPVSKVYLRDAASLFRRESTRHEGCLRLLKILLDFFVRLVGLLAAEYKSLEAMGELPPK